MVKKMIWKKNIRIIKDYYKNNQIKKVRKKISILENWFPHNTAAQANTMQMLTNYKLANVENTIRF